MSYTTEQVQELLKKPARIRHLHTKQKETFTQSDYCEIVLLQNHNALIINLDESKKVRTYVVLTADVIAGIIMEIEEATPDAKTVE